MGTTLEMHSADGLILLAGREIFELELANHPQKTYFEAVGAYQRHLAMTPADAKFGWQYFMNHK